MTLVTANIANSGDFMARHLRSNILLNIWASKIKYYVKKNIQKNPTNNKKTKNCASIIGWMSAFVVAERSLKMWPYYRLRII